MALSPHDLPGAQPVVRVTDSGLSQSEKWQDRPDQEWRVLARYLDGSGAPDARNDIVIWPEGAIPVVNFFTLENPDFLNAIGRGMGDRVLITGLSRRELRNGRVAYFNSAAIIDGVSGRPRLAQIYDKNRLVPFGEYMPDWFKTITDPLHIASLQRMGEAFTPGAPPTRLVVPDAPPAVILICYESIFPDFTPRGDDRPGWLVNVSNDAWFGDVGKSYNFAGFELSLSSTGPWQAYEMARYRSIEEGLPMARAASGGISAIIDAYGRAVRETARRGGYAEAQLPSRLPQTIYASWGSLVLALLLAILLALRAAPVRKS
jgi:apolipoprotein N-acyltransferase